MLSSTYNKVPYSILQNEVTKSFNNYVLSGKHEHVKTDLYLYVKFGFKIKNCRHSGLILCRQFKICTYPLYRKSCENVRL